ncbi:MAG: hypothetical protein AB7K24_06390 [Gemmataceae bacterium]
MQPPTLPATCHELAASQPPLNFSRWLHVNSYLLLPADRLIALQHFLL